jgi:diguanylate cyclase (GGDEF)-like protein
MTMPRLWRPADRIRLRVLALAIAAVLLIGGIDYLTGAEISIALFYVVPIALGVWLVGLRAGLGLAGMSAAVRLLDLQLAGPVHPWFAYWNILVELGFFVVVTIILVRLRVTTEHWAVLARTDPMTGVYNRRAFLELAGLELARAQRYQRFLTLAFLDIDDFKQVNDESGHPEGDRLLATVADTLRRNVRAFDIVARFGGDEFLLLLPEANDEAAELAIEKLTGALRAATHKRWGVGVSVGAVTIEGPATTLDNLLAQADRMLYQAKRDGKGRLWHQHLRANGTQGTPAPDVELLRPVAFAPLSPGAGQARR